MSSPRKPRGRKPRPQRGRGNRRVEDEDEEFGGVHRISDVDLDTLPLDKVKKEDILEWKDMADFMEVIHDSEDGLYSWDPIEKKWHKLETY